jgi:hypothetical protein
MASLATTKLLSLGLLLLLRSLSLLSLAVTGHQLTLQLRTPGWSNCPTQDSGLYHWGPRYIAFGETVEKTLLLALLIV